MPARLLEQTTASIDESLALAARWHGRANGRLRAAFAPRFAVSCSRELLEAVAALSASDGGCSCTRMPRRTATRSRSCDRARVAANVAYLDDVGLASPRLCLAHCVWVDESEQELLASREVKVLHCPGSNLKLASGIAPVADMRKRGISVSLGADGAACNNQLDMFSEMRLAGGLQAIAVGPGALPRDDLLQMATREGARALGLENEIGSIEVGKRADLILIDRDRPHLATSPDPVSAVVYAARPSDVRTHDRRRGAVGGRFPTRPRGRARDCRHRVCGGGGPGETGLLNFRCGTLPSYFRITWHRPRGTAHLPHRDVVEPP